MSRSNKVATMCKPNPELQRVRLIWPVVTVQLKSCLMSWLLQLNTIWSRSLVLRFTCYTFHLCHYTIWTIHDTLHLTARNWHINHQYYCCYNNEPTVCSMTEFDLVAKREDAKQTLIWLVNGNWCSSFSDLIKGVLTFGEQFVCSMVLWWDYPQLLRQGSSGFVLDHWQC